MENTTFHAAERVRRAYERETRDLVKCPCCGHLTMLAPDIIKRYLSSPTRVRIYDIVRKSMPEGIYSEDLCTMVYASDRNGGPDTGIDVIRVHVFRLNKDLKQFGYKIKSKSGVGHPYKLYKL